MDAAASPVTIARAVAADCDDWAGLRARLWADASEDEHRAEMAQRGGGQYLTLIARDAAGRAVGFAEASLRHEYVNGCETSPVGFLEGIYVVPQRRRDGLAGRLCAAVEAWVRDQGCAELASDADCENAEGIAFHLGAGFAETERVVFFRKVLADPA